jgi:hypothetical protein
MSLWDYECSIEISKRDEPFYALLMAAIRKADNNNLRRLEMAFPEVVDEFKKRYDAPFGVVYEFDKMTPEEYYMRCKEIERGGDIESGVDTAPNP